MTATACLAAPISATSFTNKNEGAPTRRSEWGLFARDRAWTTWAHDADDTVAYPIVPLAKNVESLVEIDEEGDRTVRYPGINWRIVLPPPAKGVLPSSTVVDVYMGLVFLYADAGFPADGRVYFSRYHLLTLLGLGSSGRTSRGERTWKPSGKHYARLKGALRYLSRVLLVNDAPDQPQLDIDGRAFVGSQGFPILQYYKVGTDTQGREAGRSFVIFSEPFVRMLAGGARTTRLDWGVYLSLPSGTPRTLFRLLCYMRQQGRSRLSLQEVFERIGSTQRSYIPARARQILRTAHAELLQKGVLSAEPLYLQMPDGTWAIEYRMGDPRELLSEEEVLVRQAMDYGVTESSARELALSHRRQFERVLAATTLGIIRPKKGLARMIVHYTRRNLPIIETPQGVEACASSHPESEYIAWAAECRKNILRGLAVESGLDPAATLARIETRVRERAGDHPDWVVRGLVQIRLNQLLGVPPNSAAT